MILLSARLLYVGNGCLARTFEGFLRARNSVARRRRNSLVGTGIWLAVCVKGGGYSADDIGFALDDHGVCFGLQHRTLRAFASAYEAALQAHCSDPNTSRDRRGGGGRFVQGLCTVASVLFIFAPRKCVRWVTVAGVSTYAVGGAVQRFWLLSISLGLRR